jgi:LysM repeat protein
MRTYSLRRLLIVLFAAVLAGAAFSVFSVTTTHAAAPDQDAAAYVVRPGDTLNAIAARYGVSASALARANGIANPNRIYIGQQLTIPGAAGAASAATAKKATTTAAASGGVYVVQPGDTLGRIAARYGTTVRALMAANGIANPDRIWVGQRLRIGKGAAAAQPPAVTRPPTTGARGRWIDVNLSRQRLTAYEGNTPVFSALISSGLPRTPTVVGRFKIYTKLTSTRMRGPGYDLPGVPYTMYFYKGYGIHGTYWHNNFGHPMSHGCVNMRTQDAAWLFNWASVGTPVVTHY